MHASNRIAVRLLPADVFARVAYETHREVAEFEVEVARCLATADCPVETLDPRVPPQVYLHDGYAVTLWTYYESLPSEIAPTEYAHALLRLHAGMKDMETEAPHFTDRVAEAQTSLEDRARTPEVGDEERALLSETLESMAASITRRGAQEQLLHGEPHAGNVLNAQSGPVFVDLQTCCRGPVEFDIVHAPEEVSQHYPGIDQDLLIECRILMLAMVTTWRWDKDDRLPNGRQRAAEWLGQMRALLDQHRLS
jgi:hypothetical protein